jgi:hypothetical protein
MRTALAEKVDGEEHPMGRGPGRRRGGGRVPVMAGMRQRASSASVPPSILSKQLRSGRGGEGASWAGGNKGTRRGGKGSRGAGGRGGSLPKARAWVDELADGQREELGGGA